MVARYAKQYGVSLDSETEAIATIGAKDALAHLLFAIIGPGDVVVSPNPAYPIHQYGVIMAEGEACMLPMPDAATFLAGLKNLYKTAAKKPKVILISFPHNPTTICVDYEFMREVVELAREHGTYIVHDFAYAELGFDGYRPPSILQVPGATDHAVEIYSMTKSYNMAGWRVGFCLGNRKLIAALARIKSYLDYGIFQPLQIAAVTGLRECDDAPGQICEVYQARRDVLIEGLKRSRLECGAAQSVDVYLGAHPRAVSKTRLARIRQTAHAGNATRRIARHRVWPYGRRLCSLQLHRRRRPRPESHGATWRVFQEARRGHAGRS